MNKVSKSLAFTVKTSLRVPFKSEKCPSLLNELSLSFEGISVKTC